jgi:hypothetical protein
MNVECDWCERRGEDTEQGSREAGKDDVNEL